MPPIGSTGVGSLPGHDPLAAQRMVFDAHLDTPYLPELPARGPGADLIGRAAARLIDLPIELAIGRWRMTSRAGRDARRAADFWRWDLDALEHSAAGYRGPMKISLAGPVTLAASLELANANVVLTDSGAFRELRESQREGIAELATALAQRMPDAELIWQLDEPSLPAALAGSIPTASGYGRIPALDRSDVTAIYASYASGTDGATWVHCCAAQVPYDLLHGGGIGAVSMDAALVRRSDYDALGEAVDGGLQLVLGVLDSTGKPENDHIDSAAQRVRELASILQIAPDERSAGIGVSASCGLAGASEEDAIAITAATGSLARRLADSPG